MDAFFSSIEQRDNPKLLGKPVIVGGSPQSRGVVCTASYEARAFGVRSAMSCAKAYQLCPQGIFIRPRLDHYMKIGKNIMEFYREVTPLVEPLSCDEAYLDITENNLGIGDPAEVASILKNKIKQHFGLTVSAGVAPNKMVAKISSDQQKPDGLVVVPNESVMGFLEFLKVEKINGVGPKMAQKLHQKEIFQIGDIRLFGLENCLKEFGSFGKTLYQLSFGHDPRPVEIFHRSKSYGAETTFSKDQNNPSKVRLSLIDLFERSYERLLRKNKMAKTVSIKIRFDDFSTVTRAISFFDHHQNKERFEKAILELFDQHIDHRSPPIRLIGFSFSGLLDSQEVRQLTFF